MPNLLKPKRSYITTGAYCQRPALAAGVYATDPASTEPLPLFPGYDVSTLACSGAKLGLKVEDSCIEAFCAAIADDQTFGLEVIYTLLDDAGGKVHASGASNVQTFGPNSQAGPWSLQVELPDHAFNQVELVAVDLPVPDCDYELVLVCD